MQRASVALHLKKENWSDEQLERKTGFGRTITGMLKPFFLTPEEGAKTAIFLASDESVRNITGEYFYNCKVTRSSRRSRNPHLARKLFHLSIKMTDLKKTRHKE